MRRHRAIAVLVTALTIVAACARSDDTTAGGSTTTTAVPGGSTTTTAAGDPEVDPGTLLENGGFGDLEAVCHDGDAGSAGATDVGVTAEEIRIATFTDKGFTGRPGLTQEMYDTAVAFAAWCNEFGGIMGRRLVVDDRDAAILAYNDRIIESCEQDFAMVGGGAVLDDSDAGRRVDCGLPNVAGYAVSPTARIGELQIQPVPNPLQTLSSGAYRRIAEALPDLVDGLGIMTSSFGSTIVVRDQTLDAATQLGYTVAYSGEYNTLGESNWRPFVESMRDSGVTLFEMVGEPENLAALQEAMQTVGFFPEMTILQTNFYDRIYVDLAGDVAQNTYVRSAYVPFEMAADNKATQDYLDLMEQYNPGGKIALLGAQGLSAWLLFAQAAAACGAELTRACLVEQFDSFTLWTGGGMHSPTNPATNTPSSCFLLMQLTPDGFVYDGALTDPTEGLFNCDDANLVELSGNYEPS